MPWRVLLSSVVVLCALAADPCNVNADCQSCVSGHLCGWCSTPVVYKNGDPGAHCASNDGTHPFACYGIFSTEDCIRGYVCNATQHLCMLGGPGEGLPYQDCISSCSGPSPPQPPAPSPGPAPPTPPPADTFLCNNSDWTCFKTTPGHGTSEDVCKQGCHAPTPSHPSPPPPPTPPPAQTYECNMTNYQCFNTTPGRGSSKEVCVQNCHATPPPPSPSPSNDRYLCNFETWNCDSSNATNATSKAQCDQLCIKLYQCDQMTVSCVIAPFPVPGLPLPDCQDNCKPHNVTPSDLLGLWRGLQINTGFVTGEWDAYFDNNNATIIGPNLERVSGQTSYLGPNPRIIFQLKVTASTFPSIPVGSELSMIFQADGASPETRFLMLASGEPNKPAPADFKTALTSSTGWDWSLASCQPGTACFFRHEQAMKRRLALALEQPQWPQQLRSAVDDPCMPYPSCDQCLAQPFCGWCSVDVIYKDGTPGRHCAGWGPNGTRNQFECHGVWHTDDCSDYQCLQPQGQCAKVPLGGGESKADCEANCKPAPPSPPGPPGPAPPTPPPADTFLCNNSDWTCFQTTPGHGTSKDLCMQSCHAPTPSHPSPPPPPTPPSPPADTFICNTTAYTCDKSTPGHGTSKEVCVQQCTKPPAPPPLQGTWRGIQIDNEYKYGEYVLTLDKGFTLTLNGQAVASGSIFAGSNPGQLHISITTGWGAGKDFLGLYTEAQGISVMHLTMVMGGGPNDQPTGWDKPWIAGGAAGNEFVFLKVASA